MNTFTCEQLAIAGLTAVTIAVIMTPTAGLWIWLALGLGAWAAWVCVSEVESAVGR
ncbi:MAG: hypothetical protein K8U03_25980 [Planctomycetia bacterium]|nr:hypothetical protein [Planctomycetia bacterium]